MIRLDEHAEGTIIWVRVRPAARRSAITGIHADQLKVAVASPPDRGRANEALVKLVAECFKIAPSRVEIVSGATSRTKRVLVRQLTAADVRRTLNDVISQS